MVFNSREVWGEHLRGLNLVIVCNMRDDLRPGEH